jgi:hypothetical protein
MTTVVITRSAKNAPVAGAAQASFWMILNAVGLDFIINIIRLFRDFFAAESFFSCHNGKLLGRVSNELNIADQCSEGFIQSWKPFRPISPALAPDTSVGRVSIDEMKRARIAFTQNTALFDFMI